MEWTWIRKLLSSLQVFLIIICDSLQANKVFFNGTSQILVTTSLIPLASGFSFKFTTCHGGALLYQSGPDNTSDFILFGVTPVKVEYTSTDSIFTPSTLVVQWRVNGENGSVNLGRNLDKNIEYQVTFKPGASSENASVELAGPSVTLSTHLPKEIVSFKHSGPLIAGNTGVSNSEVTGFVGCMESGTNIVLDLKSSTSVVAGCPLEAQSGCPRRSVYGTRCENNINDCPSHGCYNNGTCIDGIGSYKCECQPGFNGTHCENNIDDCQLHNVKCQNGARCIDLINGFKCNCSKFTSGTYCELDINECHTLSKPCNEPNGICDNKIFTGFECYCKAGWDAETNCHDSLNDCEPVGTPLCKNGATCIDLHRDYKCACAPGWTSDDCSVDIDECALGYCKNGATCYHSNNGFYNCSCAPSYMDHNCSTEINECDPNPCFNNANCTDLINDYNCNCPPGYTGRNCSIDINECESNPCLNNGTCNDLVAGYNCSCIANFTGVNCEYRKPLCIPVNPCPNNGTCVDKNRTYSCDCIPGFGGAQCEKITTIGLNGSSYMSFPIAGGKTLFALAFEFRTTLDFGLLISDPGNTLIMRLVDGEVEIVYKGTIRLLAGAGAFLMNGLYHRVELNITNNFIHLVIDNSSCGANCSKQHVLQSGQTLDHVNSLYVGGTLTGKKRKNFTGCMQDVLVNRETVIPNQNNAILVQGTVGCPRIEVCKPNPCVHGRCVDRWTDYVCECTRPWIGTICNTGEKAIAASRSTTLIVIVVMVILICISSVMVIIFIKRKKVTCGKSKSDGTEDYQENPNFHANDISESLYENDDAFSAQINVKVTNEHEDELSSQRKTDISSKNFDDGNKNESFDNDALYEEILCANRREKGEKLNNFQDDENRDHDGLTKFDVTPMQVVPGKGQSENRVYHKQFIFEKGGDDNFPYDDVVAKPLKQNSGCLHYPNVSWDDREAPVQSSARYMELSPLSCANKNYQQLESGLINENNESAFPQQSSQSPTKQGHYMTLNSKENVNSVKEPSNDPKYQSLLGNSNPKEGNFSKEIEIYV